MSYSRATLPENYLDLTSSKLLCQPEPQYLFAQFYLAAIAASLPVPEGFGLDGRQAPSSGASYAPADRDRLTISQNLPQSLYALGIDFSKTPGQTVRINRPAFIDSTYTAGSRKVAIGQTISTTPTDFGSEQTHLTLDRYAGPYSTNVQPFAIESFDANMGLFSAPSMVGAQLTRDFHKFLDAVHVVLADTGTVVYPDGMSADNDAVSVGSYPMTVEQLSRTQQLMDEAKLPTFPDGNRLMVMSPYQWKQLKHDPEYASQSSFHKEFNILFANYVGSCNGFHLFKSTTLSKPTNGSSVPVHRACAMAPGGFMAGMGRAPRVATSTNDNYGETILMIWLADLAFGVSDTRFFYSVRSA